MLNSKTGAADGNLIVGLHPHSSGTCLIRATFKPDGQGMFLWAAEQGLHRIPGLTSVEPEKWGAGWQVRTEPEETRESQKWGEGWTTGTEPKPQEGNCDRPCWGAVIWNKLLTSTTTENWLTSVGERWRRWQCVNLDHFPTTNCLNPSNDTWWSDLIMSDKRSYVLYSLVSVQKPAMINKNVWLKEQLFHFRRERQEAGRLSPCECVSLLHPHALLKYTEYCWR